MKKCGLLLAILAASSCGEKEALHSDDFAPSGSASTRDAGTSGAKDAGLRAAKDAGRRGASSTGSSTSGNDDTEPAVCESFQITSGHVLPDMLIVLDRSSSMKSGFVNRWDPSVAGITAITAQLDTTVRFGLMAFPGSGGNANGAGARCAAGELEVPIDLKNGPAIGAKLRALQLVESTPTAPTLEAAHKVLNEREVPVDVGVKGAPYIVLVTDGAPNCSVDNGRGGGAGGFDQVAFQDTIKAIEALAKDGIKTYVLGYDANEDAQLKASLDAMAVAGATGDTMVRAVDNEAALVAEFKAIAGKAVSCDFKLAEAPEDPSYVLVKVGNQQVDYNQPDGWKLSPDKLTLTLQGKPCNDLSKADGTSVSVEVQCTVVQTI